MEADAFYLTSSARRRWRLRRNCVAWAVWAYRGSLLVQQISLVDLLRLDEQQQQHSVVLDTKQQQIDNYGDNGSIDSDGVHEKEKEVRLTIVGLPAVVAAPETFATPANSNTMKFEGPVDDNASFASSPVEFHRLNEQQQQHPVAHHTEQQQIGNYGDNGSNDNDGVHETENEFSLNNDGPPAFVAAPETIATPASANTI
jgi:hypothetical protein